MRSFINASVVSTRLKLKAFCNNHLGSVSQIVAVAIVPMFLWPVLPSIWRALIRRRWILLPDLMLQRLPPPGRQARPRQN